MKKAVITCQNISLGYENMTVLENVSFALEARMQSTCPGYTPESAYDLSVNIVLYALEHL